MTRIAFTPARHVARATLRLLCIGAAVAAFCTPALGSVPDCEALAERAALARGLPTKLLPAIARTESGRGQGKLGRRAWPWTLNVQGKGYYFDTREQALAKLKKVIASGVRNVDVGCMQVNYRWHGKEFSSVEEMMDPVANTKYAALFMSRLKTRTGSWNKATQYYHSQDPKRGKYYLGKVQKVMSKVDPNALKSEVELAGGEQNGTVTPQPVTAAPTPQEPAQQQVAAVKATTSSWQPDAPASRAGQPVQSVARSQRGRPDQRFAGRGPLVTVESPLIPLGTQMVGNGAIPSIEGKIESLSAVDVPLSPELQVQMDRIKRLRAGFQRGG